MDGTRADSGLPFVTPVAQVDFSYETVPENAIMPALVLCDRLITTTSCTYDGALRLSRIVVQESDNGLREYT